MQHIAAVVSAGIPAVRKSKQFLIVIKWKYI